MRTVWLVFYVDDETLQWTVDSVHADRETAEGYLAALKTTDPDIEFKGERWNVRGA